VIHPFEEGRSLNCIEEQMKDDPAIKRIRDVRHQTSKEHDHDPQRFVKYYGYAA
jgi:hypothetical protein